MSDTRFRVVDLHTGRPIYLPSGPGLPLAEAKRLSDGLKALTYLRVVREAE